MRCSWFYLLLLLLTTSTTISSQKNAYGGLPLLVTPKPADGATVSTDLVYLQVRVTSNRENVEDCMVKFYLDGEFLDQRPTNNDGLTLFDVLPEYGDHTWYVIAEKTGHNRYTSPTFSFYFHPERELSVESIWGKTYGMGEHPIGDTIGFGVNPTVYYSSNHTRFVFQEWRSYDEGGYNGFQNEWFVHLNGDIKEIAIWETQHHVEFKTIGSGSISQESDWYYAGSILDVKVEPGQGHFFTLWEGSGSGSFTGDINDIQIQVFGPITQTAYFNTEDGTLIVSSDYGETFGSGLYQPGDTVKFGVKPKIFYINETARCLFSGWTSTSDNGYIGKDQNSSILIESSIIQKAEWTKQYFVELGTSKGGLVSRESDWYRGGDILQIIATPEYGYSFLQWIDENDKILGNQEEYEVNLSSPLSIWAEFKPKKEFTLKIVSDLDDYSEELDYYENDLVQFRVPKMIEDGNTRHLFQEWTCNTSSGYSGPENAAIYFITEPVTQHASWLTQHYVTSSDPLISGWYDENQVIHLDTEDVGMFSRETKYKVNGEKTSLNFVTVTGALLIEPYMTYNYSYLLIGAAILVLIIIGIITVKALTE
ncbi:hypothetical protein ACFL0D_04180 [Thermoproteota archaeon]